MQWIIRGKSLCYLLMVFMGPGIGFPCAIGQIFQVDTLKVDTTGKEINWQQFPDFSLPFTVVYHGDPPSDSIAYPLRKGFSHIATPGIQYKDTLFPHQRAYTFTGMATNNWAQQSQQPWALHKSPWNNDVEGYRQEWGKKLRDVAHTHYKYQPPLGEANFDIVVADIEHYFKIPQSILGLKENPNIPETYRGLSDNAFVLTYQRDMSAMYGEAVRLLRDSLHESVQVSSYSDVPIRRVFYEIYLLAWETWASQSLVLNYLTLDEMGALAAPFYEMQDMLTPSIYNFYNTDSMEVGKNYLSYNLFQIEANAAWSPKPQLVYAWLNYHYCCSQQEALQPWMAEATAIFPIMTGVQGIYPWLPSQPYGYDSYEYFIKGLYRMSQYVDFFDGNERYHKPYTAHESFVNKLPVWRAVVNGDRMLVAAQNPFAGKNDTTILPIHYGAWEDSIGLVGTEVFLAELRIEEATTSISKSTDQFFELYPNPAKTQLSIDTDLIIRRLRILDLQGKEIFIPQFDPLQAKLDISSLPAATYLLEIHSAKGIAYKKFVKIE